MLNVHRERAGDSNPPAANTTRPARCHGVSSPTVMYSATAHPVRPASRLHNRPPVRQRPHGNKFARRELPTMVAARGRIGAHVELVDADHRGTVRHVRDRQARQSSQLLNSDKQIPPRLAAMRDLGQRQLRRFVAVSRLDLDRCENLHQVDTLFVRRHGRGLAANGAGLNARAAA